MKENDTQNGGSRMRPSCFGK